MGWAGVTFHLSKNAPNLLLADLLEGQFGAINFIDKDSGSVTIF